MTTEEARIEAVQKYMKDVECEEVSTEDIQPTTWGENTFDAEHCELLVLTDEEADTLCRAEIRESFWAFSSSWLQNRLDWSDALTRCIQKMQEELCEDANEIMIRILGNDEVDAITEEELCDRGRYLAHYDDDEHEIGIGDQTLYVYRRG